MVAIRIRDAEACEPQPNLLWDTVWVQNLNASGGYGDWVMAGSADQAESRGGLRAEMALHTATMIQLFTDKRRPDDLADPFGDGDRRGWWGDSVKLADEPGIETGSLLWTLERTVLDARTALLAEDYAREALQVLIDQGAVARTEVAATADSRAGTLILSVQHYSQDGAKAFDQRFGVLWAQERVPKQMTFGERAVA